MLADLCEIARECGFELLEVHTSKVSFIAADAEPVERCRICDLCCLLAFWSSELPSRCFAREGL